MTTDDNLYVYQHLGLGDHIMCCSLIRELSKKYETISLFVKKHNYFSVKNMFDDLNISLITVNNDSEVRKFISGKNNVLKIGHEFLDEHKNLDISFYEQLGYNINLKWTEFHVNRNHEKEKELFQHFYIKEKEYIFVHEDINRKYIINKNFLPQGYPHIRPEADLTNNIFDYLYLIENAKEIHCIPSSFMFIVDCMKIKTEKNVVHKYSRPYIGVDVPTLNNEWIIL